MPFPVAFPVAFPVPLPVAFACCLLATLSASSASPILVAVGALFLQKIEQ